MVSTKTNFGYNLVLTLCNYIFPLITYPYVSRVLGVTNIGICNFVDSIIQYFILLSTLGIGSYGVREIARYKDNREKRDEVFSNLFILNCITTGIALAALIICTFTISSLEVYKPFLGIGSLQLVFTLFLTNWFFQGISDFKYITIRSVAVKSIYVVLVFLFIRSSNDTIIYYAITSLVVLMNAIANWKYGKKLRSVSLANIKLGQYIIPVLTFGVYLFLTSAYTTFNTMFLGFATNSTEVGYFATASKIYLIIMSVFTALTTVMVPRVSELLKKGEIAKLQAIASDTFTLVVIFSIPIIVFAEFFAHQIVFLISGEGFEGAEIPFRIIIVLLIIIGFEQISIQQFLMASNKNGAILAVSVVGAIVGVSMNIILTPSLGAIGAAICWGCSELAVLIVGLYLLKRIENIHINYMPLLAKCLYGAVYILALYAIKLLNLNSWLEFAISSIILSLLFVLLIFYVDKNVHVRGLINSVFLKIQHVRNV